jgi:hypothetical protein
MKSPFWFSLPVVMLCVFVVACGESADTPTAVPPGSGPAFTETCVSAGYCPLEGITATAQGPGSPTDQSSQEDCPYMTDPDCSEVGGGGGTGSTPAPGTECDPAIHPDCEKPLTAQDSATINQALRLLRAQSTFTDSLARKACAQMEGWFRDAWSQGHVFRGSFDSDSTNGGSHYGQYDPTTRHFHLDPYSLSAANNGDPDELREIAISLLHEAGHWGGYEHPTLPTFDSQGRDYYVDFPFKHLNPGANSCIAR